jgi:hypothetical protein
MKLGPVHVVSDATMAEMQRLIHRPRDTARVVPPLPSAPAPSAPDHFLHRLSPHDTSFSPVAAPDDADGARSRDATRRVTAAYRRAGSHSTPADRGVWDLLAANNPAFFAALEDGDEGAVRERLARFLRDDISWGLGFFCGETATPVARELAAAGIGNDRILADVLVSFAEAVGVARLTSPEQDPSAHARPLAGNLDDIYVRLVRTLDLAMTQPPVAGAGAFRVAGDLVSVDSLTHAYTLARLRELGVRPDSRILEIGGGYGSLAELAFRNGFRNVTVVDLPWVNVLQGYYLLMTCPPEAVTLYGESGHGPLRVLPDWCFDGFGPASFDAVVNTNSLPEMPPAVAGNYLRGVRGILADGPFLSINQEAKQQIADLAPLNCVAELVAKGGGYRRASRQRYWLRPGYVEEVYFPTGIR